MITTHEDRAAGFAWSGVGGAGRRGTGNRRRTGLGGNFKTTSFEGYSATLVFVSFMPLGSAIGAVGGALLFGKLAIRDAELAVERVPIHGHDR